MGECMDMRFLDGVLSLGMISQDSERGTVKALVIALCGGQVLTVYADRSYARAIYNRKRRERGGHLLILSTL
jgi:hypothetical protein